MSNRFGIIHAECDGWILDRRTDIATKHRLALNADERLKNTHTEG